MMNGVNIYRIIKNDKKIRKAIERKEEPDSLWSSDEVLKIFGEYFSATLQKPDAKAQQAVLTSDMDTEKETKFYRKYRARITFSSSDSFVVHTDSMLYVKFDLYFLLSSFYIDN